MYGNFARVYDKLMQDTDYSGWADYIEAIFQQMKINPDSILDLGCGTGSFCIEMAKRGYDMTGVDGSVDMLAEARIKTLKTKNDILLLNQKISEFELYGTVDVITCLMDTFNYLINKKDAKKMLSLVRNYLNPGGIFIFDINTEVKLKNVLGNNVFYEIGDNLVYLWQNEFNKKNQICRFDLTFFEKNGVNYSRYDEVHYEKVYKQEELSKMISEAGLKLISCFEEFGFEKPADNSERIFFVCGKEMTG